MYQSMKPMTCKYVLNVSKRKTYNMKVCSECIKAWNQWYVGMFWMYQSVKPTTYVSMFLMYRSVKPMTCKYVLNVSKRETNNM